MILPIKRKIQKKTENDLLFSFRAFIIVAPHTKLWEEHMGSTPTPAEVEQGTTPLERTVTADNVAIYQVPSRSRPHLEPWEAAIDLHNGNVDCRCEIFEYSYAPNAARLLVQPTIHTTNYHCHHIREAIKDCIRRGEIVDGQGSASSKG